jgi:predicted regulator of Ras-like GTPase activity (Roadblock/LC7/MglB family)
VLENEVQKDRPEETKAAQVEIEPESKNKMPEPEKQITKIYDDDGKVEAVIERHPEKLQKEEPQKETEDENSEDEKEENQPAVEEEKEPLDIRLTDRINREELHPRSKTQQPSKLDFDPDNDDDFEAAEKMFENIADIKKQDSRQSLLSTIKENSKEGTIVTKTDGVVKDTEVDKEEEKDEVDELPSNLLASAEISRRLSTMVRASVIRGTSVIDKISRIKNFDFLALRSEDHKYYKRVDRILARYSDNPMGFPEGTEYFSEYIKKIDTGYKRHK